jgi:hypothetical protein
MKVLCYYVPKCYFRTLFICFFLHNMVVEIGALTSRPMQMPPKPTTRGRLTAQLGPSATQGDNNSSTEDSIARALN